MNFSRILLLSALGAGLPAQAPAVQKCVDPTGRVSYQQGPCAPGSEGRTLDLRANAAQAPAASTNESAVGPRTGRVALLDAVIVQERDAADPGHVTLTLRPRWRNGNDEPVTVYYAVQFLDAAKVELHRDNRFRDIDAGATTTASQVLAVLRGRSDDRFDLRRLASASIRYHVKGEREDRRLDNVRIER